jgi:regulator of CtrA degradation
MSDGKPLTTKPETAPIAFSRHLAGSQVFQALFRDGMELVDETASYLDGPGRADSRVLARAGAFAYATESMRLTTRLMQLASWLLLQRAVNSGEMSAEEAVAEKAKVKLSGFASATMGSGWDDLPERLRDLIERSTRLQARIRRLDGVIGGAPIDPPAPANPVLLQLNRLAEAFGGR